MTFEHINVHVNPHDNFIEFTNIMRSLINMEIGVYSMVGTQLDTTSNTFTKAIYENIKRG